MIWFVKLLGDLIQNQDGLECQYIQQQTTEEIEFVCNKIKELAANHKEWSTDYEIQSSN